MTAKELRQSVAVEMRQVETMMGESLSSDIDLLSRTNGMLMEHKGKQVRPMLALLVAKACTGGKVTQDTLRIAAAVELLHNATLLHDDVADESNSRRGMPTVMSLLGGRASVLLGDFWLVKAMNRIFELETKEGDTIREFADTLRNLAEGEMLQLQKADTGDTTEEDYYRIIYNKTASLFVSAAGAAAVSVGASKELIATARVYALGVGMAFQIRDDILDYDGGESLGKPLGQDIRERKITLPLLGALSVVSPREVTEVREMVAKVPSHPDYAGQIVDFVHAHGGVDYAEAALQRYRDKALGALEMFPEGSWRDCLEALTVFVIKRDR